MENEIVNKFKLIDRKLTNDKACLGIRSVYPDPDKKEADHIEEYKISQNPDKK